MNQPAQQAIFHLALPVRNVTESRDFYVNLLDAVPGRSRDGWQELFLHGHQLTLHERPDEVPGPDSVRHFGIVLDWANWEHHCWRLRLLGAPMPSDPEILQAGTPQERGYAVVTDPSGNLIEFKAFRDFDAALSVA